MKKLLLTPFSGQFYSDLWNMFLGEKTPMEEPVPFSIKIGIILALVLNIIVAKVLGPFWAISLIVVEFIGCLALSAFVFPLLTGGLLFAQMLFMGWLPVESYNAEVEHSILLTLLLIFVVTGVDFLQGLLIQLFRDVIVKSKSLQTLCMIITIATAVLSANLDALTVTAALMTVMTAFLIACKILQDQSKITADEAEEFRKFLLGLMFCGLMGTMLGGMQTMIGEPQNYDIALQNGWQMKEFFFRMLPIGLPVLITGLFAINWAVKNQKYGYGFIMPTNVGVGLTNHFLDLDKKQTTKQQAALFVQLVASVLFVWQLFAHQFELWTVGLLLIIFIASFTGINDEHAIAKKFVEALGFVTILMTFYGVIAAIAHWGIFDFAIEAMMNFESERLRALFLACTAGIKSIASDNVLVEKIWMQELNDLLQSGRITPWEHDYYSIALNAGTNVPSILTPNGSAPFLFFFVSSLAISQLKVKFMDMVRAAWPVFLPCVIVMIATIFFYPELFQLVDALVPESLPYIQKGALEGH